MSNLIDETGNRYGRFAVVCMEGRDHQQKKRRLISLPINNITTRNIKDIALVAAGGVG